MGRGVHGASMELGAGWHSWSVHGASMELGAGWHSWSVHGVSMCGPTCSDADALKTMTCGRSTPLTSPWLWSNFVERPLAVACTAPNIELENDMPAMQDAYMTWKGKGKRNGGKGMGNGNGKA